MTRARAFTAGTLVVLAVSLLATGRAQAAPGDLDLSFSGDGRQITDFGGWDLGRAVAIQADGKLVVAGRSGDDFALARYDPDGSLDTSFSGDGRQTTDFGGFDDGRDVAIQPDGKIVVVGASDAPPTPESDTPPADFALARYNRDGTLDTSFSGDGKQSTDFGGTHDQAVGVALQADGGIVVAGFAGEAPPDPFGGYIPDDFAVARYNPNGTLDSSFGGDGTQTTDFSGGSSDHGEDVAIQPDGKIVLVGETGVGFALARYNVDGSLDNSFGGDGKETTDFGGWDHGRAVAIQPDGKILAAGYRDRISLGDDLALARYNADGSPDTSFSGDGKQATNSDIENDRAAGVALQSDGKIVVAGLVWEQFAGRTISDVALTRYHPDGSLDTTFAGDGRQTTDFGDDDRAEDVVIQSDGKIVAVGWGGPSNNGDFVLARYQGGPGASGPPPPPDADTTPPPEPAATPAGGIYNEPQWVGLSSEPGASIHYTTDGSDPTPDNARFDPAAPIQVTQSLTIKAIAVDAAGNRSTVASHAYTIAPDYLGEVLGTPGLISYWRLGETSGTAALDAGGANTGGYRNGVLLGRPGALLHDADPSAGFDGSNDYVHVADHASLDTGDRFTLEAWVKRSQTSSSTKAVLSKGSGSWRLSFTNNVLTLGKGGSGTIAKASVSTIDTTGFHHVVATKSGATVRLYIDGIDRTGAVTNRTIANTSAALNIGRYTSGSEYFHGLIDEVAIYNVALGAAQVQQRFKASGR